MKTQIKLAFMGIMVAATVSPVLAQSSGADTYKAKCAMCHAADGSGNTPAGKAMKVPPFDSPDVLKESDTDLIAVIKNGKVVEFHVDPHSGTVTKEEVDD